MSQNMGSISYLNTLVCLASVKPLEADLTILMSHVCELHVCEQLRYPVLYYLPTPPRHSNRFTPFLLSLQHNTATTKTRA